MWSRCLDFATIDSLHVLSKPSQEVNTQKAKPKVSEIQTVIFETGGG
jgi:hypothetical protein